MKVQKEQDSINFSLTQGKDLQTRIKLVSGASVQTGQLKIRTKIMYTLRKCSAFKNATEKGTFNAMVHRNAAVWNIIMVSVSSVSSVWSQLEDSSILT